MPEQQNEPAVPEPDDAPAAEIEPVERPVEGRPGTSITRRMRSEYDAGQVDLIRATVAKDLETPELAMFLETCARHQLDPFIKEIWAYKKGGRVVIQASRDGLLGIANRWTPEGLYKVAGNGQFLGCQSAVVREHDLFDFLLEERDDETEKVKVVHRPRDKDGQPTDGGEDGSKRGKITSAWARVRRKGHDDTFFIAYWKTYNQNQNVWKSHPDAMIQKCAESVALRKAFSVSGIVGEGELTAPAQTVTATNDESSGEIHWPDDEELRADLVKGFEMLGWRRAKIRLTVNAVGEDGGYATFEALRDFLSTELEKQEEGITDAEVVPDDEPAAA